MKKTLIIVAMSLLLVTMTVSCKKECTCTTYTLGVVVGTATRELDKDQTCSDLVPVTQVYSEILGTGVICK